MSRSRGAFTITENNNIYKAIHTIKQKESTNEVQTAVNFLITAVELSSTRGKISFEEANIFSEKILS